MGRSRVISLICSAPAFFVAPTPVSGEMAYGQNTELTFKSFRYQAFVASESGNLG